jgi:hypothetical protein
MLFSAESDEREWESVGSVPSGLATGLGAIGLYLDIMWSVLVGYMGMPVSIPTAAAADAVLMLHKEKRTKRFVLHRPR